MRFFVWTLRYSFLTLVGLGATGAALAQVAGHVVLAVGDVAALRANDRVRLTASADVLVKDTVTTGAKSNAQIRFNDNALFALRPDSEFRVEEFNYNGVEDGTERAVYRLLKGGLRTVTGQIGKLNRNAYQVLTTQATIGIRGTSYELLQCAPEQCHNADGSTVAAGLYGAVYEGTIAVTTAVETYEFSAREYFYLPNDQVPQRLLNPPEILSQRVVEPTTQLAQNTTLRFDKGPYQEFASDQTPTVVNDYQVTEDLNRVGLLGLPATTFFDRAAVGFGNFSIFVGEGQLASYAIDPSRALTALFANYGNGDTFTAFLGTAAVRDNGNFALTTADGLYWGRWEGAGSTITLQLGQLPPQRFDGKPLHYIFGTELTNVPTSGVFSYSAVGGTSPTNSANGAVGTLISGGTVTVNFGQAVASLSGLQVGFTNAQYTMSGSSSLFAGGFFINGSPTAACVGTGCIALTSANYTGFLAGNGATGAGVNYGFLFNGGALQGVVGYKKN